MKTRWYYIGIIVMIGLLVGACSEEVNVGDKSSAKVNFFSPNDALTRVHDNVWEPNDKIGINVLDGNTTKVFYDNVPYKAEITTEQSTASFIPTDLSKTIFNTTFDTPNVKYWAYYPYTSNLLIGNYLVDVSDQNDLDKLNFMVSDPETYTSTETNVSFARFTHETAVLRLSLTGLPLRNLTPDEVTVKLKNVFHVMQYNIYSKTYITGLNPKAINTLTLNRVVGASNPFTYQAVVIPQKTEYGLFSFQVSCNGENYFTMPQEKFDIERGKIYTMESHLNAEYNNFESVKITNWKDGGVPGAEDVSLHEKKNSIKMIYIPSGKFYMGDSNNTVNALQHQVELSGYYISQYEITNKQYCEFLNNSDVKAVKPYSYYAAEYDCSSFEAGAGMQPILMGVGTQVDWNIYYDDTEKVWKNKPGYDDYPVSCVSWYGAKAYALWAGGDLPTEAQWEYAARGAIINKPTQKNTLPYATGNSITSAQAKFNSTKPAAVGSYAPNSYNLYDMAGNVAEYCRDGFHQKYGLTDIQLQSLVFDPKGPNTGFTNVVIKNGGYKSIAEDLKVFIRFGNGKDDVISTACYNYGFRIAK